MSNLRIKTISGVKWTSVSTFFLAIVGLLKISVLARFLEAEDFGLMALVTFVLGFMNLFMDMGLTSAILHKQDISEYEYSSLYWVNVIISLILFGLINLLSLFIAGFYDEPKLTKLIPLMAVSIIFSALGRQFKTIEQKYLNFRYIAIIDVLGAIFGLFIGVLFAVLDYGVYALVYAALTQYVISNSIYFIRGLTSQGLLFHFNYSETKPFLKIGAYQVGSQIVNYLNRDLDILLIGKLFGSEVLGGYSLAKQLVQRPMQILNPIITKVASPVLSLIQNDKIKLKNKFLSFLNLVATANFTAYGLLVFLAHPLVLLLYGSNFIDVVILVQILSVYMFIRSVGSPVGSLVVATGRTDLEFYWNLFVLLLSPGIIFVGAQFSVEMVGYALIISTLLLRIPAWKFLINKLCGAGLLEYLKTYIPKWGRLYRLFY